MTAPLLIAHRGASAEFPENTLAAFERALQIGVDGIELDVQVTRDGLPVVFHDATLERLTGQPGRIPALTARELRPRRVRGEPIPTLAEVLALTRGRAVVQVEIKQGAPVGPIVQAIRRSGASRDVILASFERPLVRAARELAPRVPRMLIHPGWRSGRASFGELLPVLAGLGASGVSLGLAGLPSAAIVQLLKQHGFCVWCWTVNTRSAMLRLAAWGVDAVLSDHPALLRTTLTRR